MAETKLLDFNIEKSCFIIIGKGKDKRRLKEEFKVSPPQIYGRNMTQSSEEKYLGEQIHMDRNSASVAATIEKRGGKVLKFIFEIRAILDDCRSHTVGGLSAGLDIWEIAVLPYLLNNSECWLSISQIHQSS